MRRIKKGLFFLKLKIFMILVLINHLYIFKNNSKKWFKYKTYVMQ
jgi:hypothetical protein